MRVRAALAYARMRVARAGACWWMGVQPEAHSWACYCVYVCGRANTPVCVFTHACVCLRVCCVRERVCEFARATPSVCVCACAHVCEFVRACECALGRVYVF